MVVWLARVRILDAHSLLPPPDVVVSRRLWVVVLVGVLVVGLLPPGPLVAESDGEAQVVFGDVGQGTLAP